MTTIAALRGATAMTPGSRVVELGVPPAWMADGVCATGEHDPDIWFADPASPDGMLAKELCFSCPVVLTCRAWARNSNEGTHEQNGIWGGGDFNDERTRCDNGHWETESSRNRSDECRRCVADRQATRRRKAA